MPLLPISIPFPTSWCTRSDFDLRLYQIPDIGFFSLPHCCLILCVPAPCACRFGWPSVFCFSSVAVSCFAELPLRSEFAFTFDRPCFSLTAGWTLNLGCVGRVLTLLSLVCLFQVSLSLCNTCPSLCLAPADSTPLFRWTFLCFSSSPRCRHLLIVCCCRSVNVELIHLAVVTSRNASCVRVLSSVFLL